MRPLDIVVLGLSLSSSWGNGHATTWRSLLRGLARQGHRLRFLERDKPWYAAHRDLPNPDFCELVLYQHPDELGDGLASTLRGANAVIVGSYVPDGIDVLDRVLAMSGGNVAFYDIDTPVTLTALDRGDCAYIAPAQIPRLDHYLSFTGGPVLDLLRDRYRARAAHAFYCSVDDSRYRPLDLAKRWHLGYLGTYSADRQPALERLLIVPARRMPHLRFVVAGPQYPDGIAWPDNVERFDHLAPDDHAAFYGSQRTTLNITRADMIATGWSPSVRLFEAAACGTPIISDRWAGLTELLPGAILIADDSGDVTGFLEGGSHADIAARARDIVLASHTGDARACDLVRILGLGS